MFVNGEYTKSTDPDEKPAVKCHPGAVGVIGVGVGLAAAMLMGMLTTAPVDCAPAVLKPARLPNAPPHIFAHFLTCTAVRDGANS